MLIKEYRIPLPFSLEEFSKGHAYMSAISSKQIMEESNEENLELVTDEVIEENGEKVRFVHRVFHLSTRIPAWVRKVFKGTADRLKVEEKSWHRYPHIRTVYTCPLLGDRLTFVVDSLHASDIGYTHNIHNLNESELSQRVVEVLDIATTDKRYYQANEDLSTFRSKKTKRGPLRQGWQQQMKPMMCAYKLVRIDLNYWGLQKKLEAVGHEIIKGVYLRCHRQAFIHIDDWIDLSFPEILQMNMEIYKSISVRRQSNESNEDSERNNQSNQRTSLVAKSKSKISGWIRSRL